MKEQLNGYQLELEAWTSLWGREVPTNYPDTAEVSGVGEWQGGKTPDSLLVTVILKQPGFYGDQLQFSVEVNANSDLLRAVDKEREGGQEPTQLLLNSLAKAVRSAILPLVS